MPKTKVIVDRQRCIGAGNCLYVAPTAFKWREGDVLKPEVLDPSTVEREVLQEAADSCPTLAIILEDIDDS